MPRTKPITRSSNKNPVEITLAYLEEHVKYHQRCLRRSENKNILLEQELSSMLADVSSQQEEFARLSRVNKTQSGQVSYLLRHISELEKKNKDLEEKVMKYRRSSISPRTSSFVGGPWERHFIPPYDQDGMLIGYEYTLNPQWVEANPEKDPGPRPLNYDEVIQQQQSEEGSTSNNNNR
jgi:hypothetical protein